MLGLLPAGAAAAALGAGAARRLALLVVALGALCASTLLAAQTLAPDATGSEFQAQAQQWIDGTLANARDAEPGLRLEVAVGALDTRLKLAPCQQIEPYLPAGTRLWGPTRIGLRCLQGSSRWNVFLPVTVRAFGPAWVLKGSVPAGSVLKLQDAMQAEVDWAQESASILADPTQWVGQLAARPLMAGQALRHSMVRPVAVFQAGTQVRVVAAGSGFSITTDGQAMTAGVVGQPARVRMDNGRILSGLVQDSRTVRVEL